VDAIGIDVGGTKIAGALVSDGGEIVRSSHRPTNPDSPDSIVSAVLEIVAELDDSGLQPAVGVAAAAFMDRAREKIYFAPNIAWKDFPLKSILEQALGRPVRIENDANAAGWAEFRFGAARDVNSMLMLTMGTGVGGAVIDNGVLMLGGYGSAGELGHIVIERNGRECGCGNFGCLEQYASGTALMNQAREALGREDLSPEDFAALIEAGDPIAHDVFFEVCDAMGRGIASLVAVTDPETIVIGGGVARAGVALADMIQSRFLHHYPASDLKPVASVVVATLGNAAGVVGAADLARLHTQSSA
jgi:glucokinase